MNTRHQKHAHGLDSKATKNRFNQSKQLFTRALVFVLLLVLLAPTPVQAVSADDGFNPGANDSVNVMVLQADGKIIVGGAFTILGGQTRNYIGRLNPDGSLDTSFNPAADGFIYALAVQPDGRILVGGEFAAIGGGSRTGLARLNSNGSLDESFTPERRL